MDIKKIKLGVIGMSPGNGHPYSWSAIFNGYNLKRMASCPFPAIPEYLLAQEFPADFLSNLGEVVSVWSQDKHVSEDIAASANIANVCNNMDDFLEGIDAVLLARDDGENHLNMAMPILKAGLPVFIDKPFALNVSEALRMLENQCFDHQIFTCSSLRYAREFSMERLTLPFDEIIRVEATTPKKWDTYAMHILEPSFNILSDWTPVVSSECFQKDGEQHLILQKESGRTFKFTATGNNPSAICLKFITANEVQDLVFSDSFFAFRSSLEAFIKQVHEQKSAIPREQSLHLVECLALGRI